MTTTSNRARRALSLILAVALLATAAAPAAAGDEDEPSDRVTVEKRQMRIFVTTKAGDRQEVKAYRLEDGRWVPVEGEEPGATVMVLQGAEEAAKPAEAPAARTPLPTILRWLFEDAAKEEDPLDAWFEGGDDVPFARLRDALKRDGWTPARLRAWMYDMVSTHLEAFLANHGRACRGHATPQGPGWGMGHAAPPPVHPQAWMLWWDGTQWQRQPIPAPPVMHHVFPAPGGMQRAHPLAPRSPVRPERLAPRMPVPPVRPQVVPPMPPAPPVPPMPPVPPVGSGLEGLPPILQQLLGAQGTPLTPSELGGLLATFAELDPAAREALIKHLAEIGVRMFGTETPQGEKDGAR